MEVLIEKQKEQEVKNFTKDNPCICFNIRMAARAITQLYDNMFKDIGLTSTQAILLKSLRDLGSLTVNQLAEALATDRTTVTRNLKPLQRDGLVQIRLGEEDKRERIVAITEKGVSYSDKAIAAWQKFYGRVEDKIGQEKVNTLCQQLNDTIEEIKNL